MDNPIIDLTDANAVREAVREYYGARVTASAPCCGPVQSSDSTACCSPVQLSDSGACCDDSATCCSDSKSALYSDEELAAVPEEAASHSYGCGNPTAIASLRRGETVLDLGSGGGLDAFLAARQVGPEGFVYGVDMTDEMLDLARRNADKMGIGNVEFLKGHIEEVPLPDNSVDVIISNCVINLSPDKGQTLRDAFRVLRPGGRLAVSDIVFDGDWNELPVTRAEVFSAMEWAGCIAGSLTIDEYKALLADAGFEEIDIAVNHRYTLDDLGREAADLMRRVSPEVVRSLVRRITSSSISARKPQ
jgi:arsenite methyltransferase